MLRLPYRIHRELIEVAAACPGEEICGLLAGPKAHPLYRFPIENRLHRLDAFDMEPQGLIAAMRCIREQGWGLAAIYHSHPRAPARPSPTDLANNQYPETVHLIIGQEGKGWRVRAFRLHGQAIELDWAIEPDTRGD